MNCTSRLIKLRLNFNIVKNLIYKYEGFVFDLDDTLYEEILYIKGAYELIANEVGSRYQLSKHEVLNYLLNTFQSAGRTNLFNKMEAYFKIKDSRINDYLGILRTVKFNSQLSLAIEMKEFLLELYRQKKKLAILTNGNPEQQHNKIAHIEWPIPIVDILIVYANELEAKPSPKGLLYISEKLNIKADKLIFIGDSETDRVTAYNAEVDFFHIKEKEFFNFKKMND
jgi:HAD superfamily hydrolase (TIGR01549 family)